MNCDKCENYMNGIKRCKFCDFKPKRYIDISKSYTWTMSSSLSELWQYTNLSEKKKLRDEVANLFFDIVEHYIDEAVKKQGISTLKTVVGEVEYEILHEVLAEMHKRFDAL